MSDRMRLWPVMVLVAGLLWAGCAAPTADVKRVGLSGLSWQQLDVGLTLDLHNPNEISVPIDAIDWNLSLFDNAVADGQARPETEIPAGGNTDVDVPISLRLSELSDTASRLASAAEIPWKVGGTCHFQVPTGAVAVEFDRDGYWDNPLR